jgi:1-acyl-sn-glycerol-3-phosphate acyltransferase
MADAQVIRLDERDRKSAPKQRPKCRATTATGRPCRNYAVENGYCSVHVRRRTSARQQHPSSRGQQPLQPVDDVISRLARILQTRLSGQYPIDEFGYDQQLSREVLLPLFRPIVDQYFRVRTFGMNRIPPKGSALVVANHSGTVALDSLILQAVIALRHPKQRVLRNVGADLVFQLPVVGPMARKIGNVLACDEDTYALLGRGELVGVFPEGYKGVGKGWRDRYRLQRFGRGGFIEVALRAQVPIIPVSIVGAEEAFPMIGNIQPLARLLRLPYFPVTPTFPLLGPLGAIPFPSKWVIEFGDPIHFDHPPEAADDKMLLFDLSDEVRDTIQQMIYKNLKLRGGAFF